MLGVGGEWRLFWQEFGRTGSRPLDTLSARMSPTVKGVSRAEWRRQIWRLSKGRTSARKKISSAVNARKAMAAQIKKNGALFGRVSPRQTARAPAA